MVNDMNVPSEFKKFGLQFIQDLHLRGDTFDELIHNVLKPFKGEERERLRMFLNELLDARVPDAELQRLWNATPSDVDFRDAGDLRTVLRAARDRL